MKITEGSRELQSSSTERKQRGIAFVVGVLIEALIIGLAVVAGMWFPYQLERESNRYTLITLSDFTPEKLLPTLPPVPRPNIPKVRQPKIATPRVVSVPRLQVQKVEVPRIQAKLHSPDLPKLRPVTPVAMAFAKPSPIPARPAAPLRVGDFGGPAHTATLDRPLKEVQTGGFGNSQGFTGEAKGGNPGNVPRLGAFGLPEGPGVGNGTGGSHGSSGTVASAGFGSGVAGSGAAKEHGGSEVKTGGFDVAETTDTSVAPRKADFPPAPAPTQPVEILSKPLPSYTDEARKLGVEGEVVLSVVFQADGTLRVVGVVKSLGHGLDQAAVQAASQIRFRPAERRGQPVNSPATLHIEFRLA